MTATSKPPTKDSLWNGAVILWQPARGAGYRFNLDPVLVYGFARPATHVLDVGAGCGVLGLLLLAGDKAREVTGVEVQESLAELIDRNVHENEVHSVYRLLRGDVRDLELPVVDAVVCNPPYFRAHEGRAAPDEGRDMARRERNGTLSELLASSLRGLHKGGTWTGIVPIARANELIDYLEDLGAVSLRLRQVVPRSGRPVGHMLVEAVIDSSSGVALTTTHEPNLVVHVGEGERRFSAEVASWLRQSRDADTPASNARRSVAAPDRE